MAKLNNTQIAQLKTLMNQREQRLRDEIRSELRGFGEQRGQELAGQVGDVGDESVASLHADLNIAIADRQIQEVARIEAAKSRIEDKSYGTCVECGADIGFPRLKAYPTAMRCVICQEQHEKTYAHDGKPSL
jgi:DnaK suppressor protein